MQPKRDPQSTFFDLAVAKRGGTNRVLETIANEVDFTKAEQEVAATYGTGGRAACRVGVLLRIMILQHLYGLSDPQVEEQIKDRLSFLKFIQLDAHESVPDERTICRFRQRLIECELHEKLLGMLNEPLEARGHILKRTTLVDATILQSSRKRPHPDQAADGTAPDADAGYTRKNNRSYYGYKAHISSDGEHQLIRRAVATPAGKQDAHVFAEIAPEDTQEIYGDKAYDTKDNKVWLRKRKIRNRILKQGALHIKLSVWDKRRNREKGRVRGNIERIFGHLKKWQGYRRVRYLGLAKNQLELTLKAVAYNLKRLVKIMEMSAT